MTDRVFFFITCLINQSECVLSLLAAFANLLESLRLQLMFFTTEHLARRSRNQGSKWFWLV